MRLSDRQLILLRAALTGLWWFLIVGIIISLIKEVK